MPGWLVVMIARFASWGKGGRMRSKQTIQKKYTLFLGLKFTSAFIEIRLQNKKNEFMEWTRWVTFTEISLEAGLLSTNSWDSLGEEGRKEKRFYCI
jgi:hypothetical protein